jgi:hypothetical protein
MVVWTPTSAMRVVVVEDDGVIDTAAGGGYCDEADYDVWGLCRHVPVRYEVVGWRKPWYRCTDVEAAGCTLV